MTAERGEGRRRQATKFGFQMLRQEEKEEAKCRTKPW